MSVSFTKLFSSILQSTIWVEPIETRVVWVTMLALSDRHGDIMASVPGLAQTAGVPLDKCEQAIARFLAPDHYSRSQTEDGRRIRVIDGGWQLINYSKYRDLQNREDVLASKRKWIAKKRAQQRQNVTVNAEVVTINPVDRTVEK